jgi:hypothetical protein
MCEVDRKYFNLVGLLLARDHLSTGQAELQFPQLAFDLHFPHAHHTKQDDIRPILT